MYPTLLAAIGDVVNPAWRASTVGVYRLWRDMGYAFSLLSGVMADAFGVASAIWFVAALTFLSGVVAAVRMRESCDSGIVHKINHGKRHTLEKQCMSSSF